MRKLFLFLFIIVGCGATIGDTGDYYIYLFSDKGCIDIDTLSSKSIEDSIIIIPWEKYRVYDHAIIEKQPPKSMTESFVRKFINKGENTDTCFDKQSNINITQSNTIERLMFDQSIEGIDVIPTNSTIWVVNDTPKVVYEPNYITRCRGSSFYKTDYNLYILSDYYYPKHINIPDNKPSTTEIKIFEKKKYGNIEVKYGDYPITYSIRRGSPFLKRNLQINNVEKKVPLLKDTTGTPIIISKSLYCSVKTTIRENDKTGEYQMKPYIYIGCSPFACDKGNDKQNNILPSDIIYGLDFSSFFGKMNNSTVFTASGLSGQAVIQPYPLGFKGQLEWDFFNNNWVAFEYSFYKLWDPNPFYKHARLGVAHFYGFKTEEGIPFIGQYFYGKIYNIDGRLLRTSYFNEELIREEACKASAGIFYWSVGIRVSVILSHKFPDCEKLENGLVLGLFPLSLELGMAHNVWIVEYDRNYERIDIDDYKKYYGFVRLVLTP
jgi:hypothetical protein